MYAKVLAAVNEHLNSEVSARYALHLAKEAGARIYFCSIAENGLDKKSFHLAEEAVKRLSHRARELGVQTDCILETGNPIEQIKKIVISEGIDIVFAATRREDVKSAFTRTPCRRLSLALPAPLRSSASFIWAGCIPGTSWCRLRRAWTILPSAPVLQPSWPGPSTPASPCSTLPGPWGASFMARST
jgi:hypothetical protein